MSNPAAIMRLVSRYVEDLKSGIHESMVTLRQIKAETPEFRVSVNSTSRGSILNGYREGDLTFEEAVAMLRTANQD